jgi:hypothetical protein
MSLTSYRAAPPRATLKKPVLLRSKGPKTTKPRKQRGFETNIVEELCPWQAWQRPTLPGLET